MVYIVLPAYNETKNIGRVVRDLFQLGDEFKVIVVDDGSSDETARVARDAGALVLRHPINRGQGAALHTGNEYARRHGADVVVHFDGDGQFSAGDILPAVEKLKRENLDVVLGSRFLDKRSDLPWSKRYVILPVSRWIQNVLIGVKLTDVHNGFRVLNRRALETIDIRQDGMAHNTEIISQIKKYNLRFAEVPVEVKYTEYGQGLRGGLQIASDLVLELFKI